MEHRYATGDRVSLAFGFYDTDAVGIYVVTRQLPFVVGGEPQYRVKGADDRERVIGESQIQGAGRHANWAQRPRSPHNAITNALDRLSPKEK